MTIQQFLLYLCALAGLYSLWITPLPLPVRATLCLLGAALSVLVGHGRLHGHSLLGFCFIVLRFRLLVPKTAVWRRSGTATGKASLDASAKEASVQELYVGEQAIRDGHLVIRHAQGAKGERWTVVAGCEVGALHLMALSPDEQARVVLAYQDFLVGLPPNLPLVVKVLRQPTESTAQLQAHREGVARLVGKREERLAALAQVMEPFLAARLGATLSERRYAFVMADSSEHPATTQGGRRAGAGVLLGALRDAKHHASMPLEQVHALAETRLTTVMQGLSRCGVQGERLTNEQMTTLSATCLALAPVSLQVPQGHTPSLSSCLVPTKELKKAQRSAHSGAIVVLGLLLLVLCLARAFQMSTGTAHANAPVTAPLPCAQAHSDENCNGADPIASLCSQDASTVPGREQPVIKDGRAVGYVALRMSGGCNTYWLQAVGYTNSGITTIYGTIHLPADATHVQGATNTSVSQQMPDGSVQTYTNMAFVQEPMSGGAVAIFYFPDAPSVTVNV